MPREGELPRTERQGGGRAPGDMWGHAPPPWGQVQQAVGAGKRAAPVPVGERAGLPEAVGSQMARVWEGVGVRLCTCEARERPRKWRTDGTSWRRRLGTEDISF